MRRNSLLSSLIGSYRIRQFLCMIRFTCSDFDEELSVATAGEQKEDEEKSAVSHAEATDELLSR